MTSSWAATFVKHLRKGRLKVRTSCCWNSFLRNFSNAVHRCCTSVYALLKCKDFWPQIWRIRLWRFICRTPINAQHHSFCTGMKIENPKVGKQRLVHSSWLIWVGSPRLSSCSVLSTLSCLFIYSSGFFPGAFPKHSFPGKHPVSSIFIWFLNSLHKLLFQQQHVSNLQKYFQKHSVCFFSAHPTLIPSIRLIQCLCFSVQPPIECLWKASSLTGTFAWAVLSTLFTAELESSHTIHQGCAEVFIAFLSV